MRGVALLLAAGEGARLGCGPKGFVELAGVPLVRRAAENALAATSVDRAVAAVPPGRLADARSILDGLDVDVVEGGPTRQGSAARAARAAGDPEALAVHDAARPLCPSEVFDRCLRALDDAEAVVPALAVRDTLKQTADGRVVRTLDRARIVAVQTPQCFRTQTYLRALDVAERDTVEATDDAGLVERMGIAVVVVDGDERSLKVTTPADLRLAESLV